jgi:hypothetical protein
VKGRVFDVPALVDVATGATFYSRALLDAAAQQVIPIAVPASALAVAWALVDAKSCLSLATLCELGITVVLPLDEPAAALVGEVLERPAREYGAIDVVAAHVAAISRDRGWPVVTDRGPQLRALVPGLEIDSLP